MESKRKSRPNPGPELGTAGELPWSRAAAYGIPACAISGPSFFVQSYFLNFATDVLLLAPALVGILLAGVRIWDSVSDPLVGFLSDRTRSRFGRRRPWMLAAAPFAGLSFAIVWNPPVGWQAGALTAWVGCALVLFTTAATAWNIPHAALGASLAGGGHARAKVFGLRYACMITGVACSFGAMQWVVNSEEPRAAAGTLGVALAVGITAMLWIPPLTLDEPRSTGEAKAPSAFESVRAVLGNPQARRLLLVAFAEDMALGAQGAAAPYMAIYVLERPDMIGLLPACFIAPMVLSVPLWISLAKHFGRERTWMSALAGGSAAYLGLFTLDTGDLLPTMVLLGVAGFFSGCGGPNGPALLADVLDRDAANTGTRKEGMFFAAWLFVGKAAGALSVLLLGVALQMADFVPNTPATPGVEVAIRASLGVGPAVMFAGAVWALRRYQQALSAPGEMSSRAGDLRL